MPQQLQDLLLVCDHAGARPTQRSCREIVVKAGQQLKAA